MALDPVSQDPIVVKVRKYEQIALSTLIIPVVFFVVVVCFRVFLKVCMPAVCGCQGWSPPCACCPGKESSPHDLERIKRFGE